MIDQFNEELGVESIPTLPKSDLILPISKQCKGRYLHDVDPSLFEYLFKNGILDKYPKIREYYVTNVEVITKLSALSNSKYFEDYQNKNRPRLPVDKQTWRQRLQ